MDETIVTRLSWFTHLGVCGIDKHAIPFWLCGESRADLTGMTLEELFQVEITGSTFTLEGLKTVPSAVSVFSHGELSRMDWTI